MRHHGRMMGYVLVVTLAIGVLILVGCPDPAMDPCEGTPIPAVSRPVVHIAPGHSTNVTVTGTPPFHIITAPDPAVATAAFLDSTISPAVLAIVANPSATIGDETGVVIADNVMCSTLGIEIEITTITAISYSDHIQPIWDVNCQSRGCHPGGGAPFSLDRFVSWSNLWYAAVTNMNCGAIYRVVGGLNGGPGNPDSSLVYLVVSGRTSCPRMPFSPTPGDTLSLIEQDMIKAWILEGGQNN